ncbi:MAG: hypothetical protein HYY00_04495 [Chloroflexi bacterium]|nr:hypothetical protein [Chloroflexota bacterium]
MVEFEKRRIPTVSWTAQHFIHDARRSGENFGLPSFPIAVMPTPFTNQTQERIHQMVDASIDQVIAGLTQPVEAAPAAPRPKPTEVLTFQDGDLLAAAQRMNDHFLEQAWSDGFPLVPPTAQAVERMLQGTKRKRDEVVVVLEPGFGIATVEKIAINAVMAGCRPDHLPVVIAAVQCLADPKMYLRNKAMSTGPHAPLILVNGPIASRLNINSGCCALGPGSVSYANSVIGRALRLVMMNVGHTYPAVSDMDTIGSPTKYSMCFAENVEGSPWEPYHVEHGYDKDASTVTVWFVYGICELKDFTNSVPENLVEVFSTAATNVAQVGTGLWLMGRRADPRYGLDEKEHNTVIICPEHATLFHEAGWDKERIRQELYRRARMPFRLLMLSKEKKGLLIAHPELQWLWDCPETPLPIVETPDCFDIVVAGTTGGAGRGAYFYGAGEPVTKPVEE